MDAPHTPTERDAEKRKAPSQMQRTVDTESDELGQPHDVETDKHQTPRVGRRLTYGGAGSDAGSPSWNTEATPGSKAHMRLADDESLEILLEEMQSADYKLREQYIRSFWAKVEKACLDAGASMAEFFGAMTEETGDFVINFINSSRLDADSP